jgi:hypothetical protein
MGLDRDNGSTVQALRHEVRQYVRHFGYALYVTWTQWDLLGGEIGKFGFHGVRWERWRKRKACSAILKQSCRANHRNSGSFSPRAASILLTPRASRNNGRPNSLQPSTSPSSETAPPVEAPHRHDARPGFLTMRRPGCLGMRRLSLLLVYCVQLRTRPLLQYVCTLCGFSLSF